MVLQKKIENSAVNFHTFVVKFFTVYFYHVQRYKLKIFTLLLSDVQVILTTTPHQILQKHHIQDEKSALQNTDH